MKRILIVLLLMAGWLSIEATNTLTLSNASGSSGDEVSVSVSLSNTDEVSGLQMSIPLNSYMKYVEGSCQLSANRSNDHNISASTKDNKLTVVVYSVQPKALKGSSGELFNFKLKLGSIPGVYTLTPTVKLGNADGSSLDATVNNGNVTLLAPSLDIQTKSVDFGHVPIRSTYTRQIILSNNGTADLHVTSVECSADEMTPNETAFTLTPGSAKYITLSFAPEKHGTITEKVTIKSDAGNGKNQTIKVTADPYSVNELHVGNAEGLSDTEVTIPLTMNNMEDITGVQCTFDLPDELQFVEGSFQVDANRSNGHSAVATLNGNELKLMIYSISSKVLNGNDGEVGSFKVRLNGKSGSYLLSPKNVVLGNANLENMTSASLAGRVQISSPKLSVDSELKFGRIPVSVMASVKFQVGNGSRLPLTISKISFLLDGFSVVDQLPLTIPANSSKEITVQYTPMVAGDVTTCMNIYSNDPERRMKSVAVTGVAYEPNTLTIAPGTSTDDSVCTFDVSMDNYSTITGLQMDLHWLPEATTTKALVQLSDRLSGLSHSITRLEDGVYRLLIYSLGGVTVKENTGCIFSVSFNVSELTDYQGSEFYIDNVILGSSDGLNMKSGAAKFSYVVPLKTNPDVNMDGVLSIADVSFLINALNNKESDSDANTDVNGDGKEDIKDVEYLAVKVLEYQGEYTTTPPEEEPDEDPDLSFDYSKLKLSDFTQLQRNVPIGPFKYLLATDIGGSGMFCYLNLDVKGEYDGDYLIDFSLKKGGQNFRYNSPRRWVEIFQDINLESEIGDSKTFELGQLDLKVTKTNLGVLLEFSVPIYVVSAQSNFYFDACYYK